MLTLALAATLVGFVLLVLGLVTGTVWLAVACIVVCLIGLAFLIFDIVGSGRRKNARSLDDLVGRDTDGPATADTPTSRFTGGDADTEIAARASTGRHEALGGSPGSGTDTAHLGSGPPGATPTGLTATGGFATQEGNYGDYLRSVGGGLDEAPPSTRPVPAQQVPGPQDPARQVPTQQVPIQQTPVVPGPAGADYVPRPYRFDPPDADTGAGPGWDNPPVQPAAGDEEPAVRRHVEPSERARHRGFDPLDPNWRPPSD